MIFKKDLGLLVLILVVGAVVAIINPRFLLAGNLSNTANQIGLFGILSIAQAFVIVTGRTLDVGRQGQLAVALEQFEQILACRKAQVVELANATEHLDVEGICQTKCAAAARRFARPDLGQGLVRADGALDQDFDLAAAGLCAVHAGVNHTRVVEYKQILGADQRGQVGEAAVQQGLGAIHGRLYDQQATCAALCKRGLGDEIGR